ncbi:MAG: hypothetical protein AAB719_02155 [Patescibacteria group bacterium]
MRKRKFYLAILVIVVLVAVYFLVRGNSVNKTGVPVLNEDGEVRRDPSNATFTFDGEAVTLRDGQSEEAVVPGSAVMEETLLLDKFAYGDINSDGKEDTLLLLARYGAGSGTFIYLAAVVSGPVTYRGTEAVFIGDRVTPQSISVNGSTATVKYLDRKSDEALAAEPTVLTSKQFTYRNGGFQER